MIIECTKLEVWNIYDIGIYVVHEFRVWIYFIFDYLTKKGEGSYSTYSEQEGGNLTTTPKLFIFVVGKVVQKVVSTTQ